MVGQVGTKQEAKVTDRINLFIRERGQKRNTESVEKIKNLYQARIVFYFQTILFFFFNEHFNALKFKDVEIKTQRRQ